MRQVHSIITFLFFTVTGWFGAGAFAQENINANISDSKSNNDVQLLYRHEREFGVLMHSAGWGFNYRTCKHVTGYKKRVIEFELVTLSHPKEIKIQVPDIGTKGYYYGKQFDVIVSRTGLGYNKVITGKSDRRGVELRLLTMAGACLAFAKPIYVNIWHQDPVNPSFGNITTEKYDPSNPMHTPAYIVGSAGYFTGFTEMNFFPGIFYKMGLSFEHSTLDDDIKLLEVGFVVDAYYKTIPMMANTQNNQVFLNLYLNVMIGKKWF